MSLVGQFQPLAVDLEGVLTGNTFQLNYPMRVYFVYSEWTRPSRLQLSREQLQPEIEQENQPPFPKFLF